MVIEICHVRKILKLYDIASALEIFVNNLGKIPLSHPSFSVLLLHHQSFSEGIKQDLHSIKEGHVYIYFTERELKYLQVLTKRNLSGKI